MSRAEAEYEIIIEKKVKKDLKSIPPNLFRNIYSHLKYLANNPRPKGCLKLTDREGYRIRVGDYRILYMINDTLQTVTIYRVIRRSERTYK